MIGILSAVPDEIKTLVHHLENKTSTLKGKRRYYQGTLFEKEVVLVFSRWGKVASATTATQLINDFDVDELVFTGVAGAISPDLNIGDLVIGKRLVQHDMNASPLFSPFEIPLLDKTFFETSSSKRAQLSQASTSFLLNYNQVISAKEQKDLKIKHPKVVVGDICSGDQFISSPSQVEAIAQHLPTALCVEMEGAAVAQVCYEYDIPFSILRIISDKANEDAPIDFPVFTEKVASKYALEIFKHYFTPSIK